MKKELSKAARSEGKKKIIKRELYPRGWKRASNGSYNGARKSVGALN